MDTINTPETAQVQPENSPLIPDYQPPAPESPEPKRHVRRVGTFTMGIALVIAGLALCATFFMPVVDVLLIAKLSPLLLVALGVEIVVAAARNNGSKIKYDFLSFFMCIILITGSICASLIPTFFEYFGPEREIAQSRIEHDITTKLLENQSQFPGVFRVTSNVNLSGLRKFTGKETAEYLQIGDWVSIYVELSDKYDSEEAFAAAVLPIFNAAKEIVPGYLQLGAKSITGKHEPYYEINLGNGSYVKLTSALIAQNVIRYSYSEDYGIYGSDEELAGLTKQTEEYQMTIDELRASLEQLRSEKDELQMQLDELQSNTENNTSNLEIDYKNQIADLESQIEDLKASNNELEAQLANSQ